MKLTAGTAPDQYHAFTTRLTASGYQAITMRVVAGCIIALGIPSLLAGTVPSAAPWPGFRFTYVAIAFGCLALAAPWLRYRWPSRRQSATVVVVGTLALATGSLATIDPVSGLLVGTSFCFILGFTALFHSSRLLAFVAVIAGITLVVNTARIAAAALPDAIALAIPVLLLFVVVTFGCRTMAQVGGSGDAHYDVDPLTGLLTRGAFYECTSELIGARHRDEDRYLAVAVVDIDGFAAIASVQGGRGADDAQSAVGQALRETTRREAVVAHVARGEFLIADIFATVDPAPLVERIRGAVAATPLGITASIGAVSARLLPLISRPPHEVLDEMIATASTAMAAARRRGGNQVSYILDLQLNAD